ncbi:MAG: endolytic transglycosylase MltG [Bacteroidaceae bacterium]|nr:endolytic transglycosylase MltG [Bacteroidaceae bacterium]
MKLHISKRIAAIIAIAIGCSLLLFLSFFFLPFSRTDNTEVLFIDRDDTSDSVFHKLKQYSHSHSMMALHLLAHVDHYEERLHTGRYEVEPSISTFALMRRLLHGRQSPVRLTIPTVHTMKHLAKRLSKHLEADSATLAEAFTDPAFCEKHGCDTATLPCLFIPNTYEVYWDITPDQLAQRMKRESEKFWTTVRKNKAEKARLTPEEVITLASIVEKETANNQEKPDIAGLYLNRLRKGMKLQADPTVKFALQDFGLRRILNKHLTCDSPYNTYVYAGLPPGPICLPSIASIDAVLNHTEHNYIYMCAKEDFSGTHNFAATYEEHKANARKYVQALNERGIK